MPSNPMNKDNTSQNVLPAGGDVLLDAAAPVHKNKDMCVAPSGADVFLDTETRGEDKTPACLRRLKNAFNRVVPYGGIASSVFNLISVCLGAGILGIPAATTSSGLVMAFLYLIVLALFGVYSLHIICITIDKTGFFSFESTAKGLIGQRFVYFVSFIRWMNSFGATIAYVISIGDILEPILSNIPGAPASLKGSGGRRIFTSVVWVCILLPLIILRQVNSLRYVSAVAVSFVLYFVLLVTFHACDASLPQFGPDKRGEITLFATGNSAIHGLGVFMFAFVCQINCYEIYWEMKDRSIRRFTVTSAIAMAVCAFAYGLTSFFGYAEFGNTVKNSILHHYNPVSNAAIMIGYIGMLIKLCASYALQTMAYRNTVYHLIGWDIKTLSAWKHILFVVFFSVVVLVAGLFIPNINTVFGLVGAICGGFLSFVFPALFYLYSGGWTLKSVGFFNYFFTYALLIAGVIGIVFGTVSSFEGLFDN